MSFLIGEQLKRDWENINDDRLLLNLETPLKVIMAGKNDLKNAWEQKLEKLNQNAGYSVLMAHRMVSPRKMWKRSFSAEQSTG